MVILFNTWQLMMVILLTILLTVLFLAAAIKLLLYDCCCNPNAARTWPSKSKPKPGLGSKVIHSFPIFHYSDLKDLKFGRDECAVCIGVFENDDVLRLLPKCDHVFHSECIDAWLASHSTCPLCRANLTLSKKELRQMTRSTRSIDSNRAQSQNQNQSQSQNHDQIAIDIELCTPTT